ncbi:Uma2 family endonuclease [Streptomyces cavernae]|uniref:Uma2 family endonuclease n=1 Tax=Streptomyces cavernae TaxID=2259034 RepID=UPI000FEB9691|nr:Uma2 family endonuclease [Streptomyces cavernae]
MRALTVSQEPDQSWDDLVRFWEGMEWPEGSKVEIIEGIITVSPAPASGHNVIASRIHRRLLSVIPEEWEVCQTLAVAVPSRLGMFIPDLVVVRELDGEGEATHIPAGMAELAVEITSKSNARHDRVSKPTGYAAAGVPLYLLVDRWAERGPTVTLYGQPKGGVYRVLSTVKFGEPIKLPAPFDLVIDTSEFPAK